MLQLTLFKSNNWAKTTTFFILQLLALTQITFSQEKKDHPNWKKIITAQDFNEAYPKDAKKILNNINLNYKGLEKVKHEVDTNNTVRALEFLIEYYEKSDSAKWLRSKKPAVSTATNSQADLLLSDTFSIQGVKATQPRLKNGKLNWTHNGPNNDQEWSWLLNRHSHFNTLISAYLNTGNDKYAKYLSEQINDWVSSNPYTGKETNSSQWRALEAGLRVGTTWPKVFFGLQTSDQFTPTSKLLMLTSIHDHAEYLRNFHSKHGNHVLMQMSGLTSIGVSWPEFKESTNWIKYAIKLIEAEMTNQVYPDGVQKELTSHYHHVSLLNFDKVAIAVNRANYELPESYKNKIILMYDYLAKTMRPNGYGIMNNDGDLAYNRDKLKTVAQRFNRDDWLYITTNGKEGKMPDGFGSHLYPWAGQLLMRSGYEESSHWAFFDIGPWGLAHQHNDKLHLSVNAYGRDLLVDSGRFAYRGKIADQFRNSYARHSAGHNVILINAEGQKPNEAINGKEISKNTYYIDEKFDYARGSVDNFYNQKGKVKHTRAVFYIRGKFWVVIDEIQTDQPRSIQALWHWHPDCNIEINGQNVSSIDIDLGNLGIFPVGDTKWEIKTIKGQKKPTVQGWYSPKYNTVTPSSTSIYTTDISKTKKFVWVLKPALGKVEPSESEIITQDKESITVKVESFEAYIPINGNTKPTLKTIE